MGIFDTDERDWEDFYTPFENDSEEEPWIEEDEEIFDFRSNSEIDTASFNLIKTIYKSIRKDFEKRITELEKENAELYEIKKDKQKYDREISQLKFDLERAKTEAKHEAIKMSSTKILESVADIAWVVEYKYEYVTEKCNKCDKDRKIHFKSPSGKDLTESCDCAERHSVYTPKEAKCIEIVTTRDGGTEYHYVVRTASSSDGSAEWVLADNYHSYAHVIWDESRKFEDIKNAYSWYVFLNKEDCQRFCDYLSKHRGN